MTGPQPGRKSRRGPITTRGIETLQFIERHIAERGYPPTVRAIGEAIGISSPSTVHGFLERLADLGYIERSEPGSPRALKLLRRSDGTTVPDS